MADTGAFPRAPTAHAAVWCALAWVHTPRSCHGDLNHALIAKQGRADMLVSRVAAMATEEGEDDELVLTEHPADGAVPLLLGRDPAVAYAHPLGRRAQGKARPDRGDSRRCAGRRAAGYGSGTRARSRPPGLCGSRWPGNQSGSRQTGAAGLAQEDAAPCRGRRSRLERSAAAARSGPGEVTSRLRCRRSRCGGCAAAGGYAAPGPASAPVSTSCDASTVLAEAAAARTANMASASVSRSPRALRSSQIDPLEQPR